MATWHQNKNPSGIAAMWAPHPTEWKCVGDKPGELAGCITFANKEDAQAYCERTGDCLIPPLSGKASLAETSGRST